MAESLEQEIAQLEQQLTAKRQALEEEGGTPEAMPSDRELVHHAVGERIQQQAPAYQPAPVPSATGTPSWQDPAIAQQVQSLVNVAFAGSLDDAIARAINTHNAAIIDAFHDILRDQLYDELVKRGKLKPV